MKELNNGQETNKKVLWLSPKKLVFEWKKMVGVHFPWGYSELGEKSALIIAEEGKDLFFVDNGGDEGYFKDLLCWYCQNSISLRKLGHVPTCLLGKYIFDITICQDFIPGPSFGENMDNDVGERRIMAEKILPLIQWQRCNECQFFNNDKAYQFIGTDEAGIAVENPLGRFCKILHSLPKLHYGKTCKHFEMSKNPLKVKVLEDQKKSLYDYIKSLKTLENKSC
jgi:hypothetical protein